ncbi:MAG: hypothetical protein L0Y72_06910 [Gemmataceae bacterium]|nr:hypothetical protein [Gemmataceae bacterium]
MAENESLDLAASHSQRWRASCSAILRKAPLSAVVGKIRKALYGGINKARKQFRNCGVGLGDFLAFQGSRIKLRELVRKTEGHHYSQLLESSAHASAPTAEDGLRGWGEAILDRVFDQVSHRVAGTDNWPTFFDVKKFTDDVRHALAEDIEHIASKLAQDPESRLVPKRAESKAELPDSPTEELLRMSLLGEPKP